MASYKTTNVIKLLDELLSIVINNLRLHSISLFLQPPFCCSEFTNYRVVKYFMKLHLPIVRISNKISIERLQFNHVWKCRNRFFELKEWGDHTFLLMSIFLVWCLPYLKYFWRRHALTNYYNDTFIVTKYLELLALRLKSSWNTLDNVWTCDYDSHLIWF